MIPTPTKQNMTTLLNNFTNGNLKEVRQQAKRFSHRALRDALKEQLGYSALKAALTADWMKTGHNHQESCDAV